jgi:hypothetical protein
MEEGVIFMGGEQNAMKIRGYFDFIWTQNFAEHTDTMKVV